MVSAFLVDSDIVISYTKRQPSARALLEVVIREDDAPVSAISAITAFEVLQGLRHPEKPVIRRLLDSFRCLPVTEQTAHLAATLVRRQRERGHKLDMGDALIAATALIHGLVLVTGNRRHFADLGVDLYSEDWPTE